MSKSSRMIDPTKWRVCGALRCRNLESTLHCEAKKLGSRIAFYESGKRHEILIIHYLII